MHICILHNIDHQAVQFNVVKRRYMPSSYAAMRALRLRCMQSSGACAASQGRLFIRKLSASQNQEYGWPLLVHVSTAGSIIRWQSGVVKAILRAMRLSSSF
jgi:hypothetical protein